MRRIPIIYRLEPRNFMSLIKKIKLAIDTRDLQYFLNYSGFIKP